MQFSTLFLGNLDLQVRRADEYLFGILITAGKKALTRHWLLPDRPTIQEWIGIVNDIYLMEKITFAFRKTHLLNFGQSGLDMLVPYRQKY